MASSNALAVVGTRDMTPAEAHAAYIEEKREVIVATFIPEAFRKNVPLIDMFLELSKSRMLNPFAKQIYCIPRGRTPSIEVSIDGYRLIASRSNEYGGRDEYTYDREDAKNPNRATCTVYRIVRGVRCPFTATVRWDEFGAAGAAADHQNLWKSKPYHMLGITAERHALKAAFPEEMMAVDAANGELGGYEGIEDVPPPREIRQAVARPVTQARVAPLSAPRVKAQPNGREEAARKLIAEAAAKGVTLDIRDAADLWADDVDAALEAAGSAHRVPRDGENQPLAGALTKALLALPSRTVDVETGEVREEEPVLSDEQMQAEIAQGSFSTGQ